MVLENKIFKSRQLCIFAITCHLPLGKGVVLHLNKLESPLLKNAFCQVRFKWVLGKKTLKFCQLNSLSKKLTDRRTVAWTARQTDMMTTIYPPTIHPNPSCNKRPIGHIAHMRKQFKSINTHDYYNVN